MAVVHAAQLTPSKPEIVTAWLDRQPWGLSGPVEMIGGYRFDDPAGEVGIEGVLVRRADTVLHVPMTYRGRPLPGVDRHLIATLQHSVLGERWVYDAPGDPVAIACYFRALAGEQDQAPVERHLADGTVELIEPPVRISLVGSPSTDGSLAFTHDLADPVTGGAALVAEWPGGSGVIVALR